MTNLTFKEKEALQEVFLCFQDEEKWYERGIVGKLISLIKKIISFLLHRKRYKNSC